MLMDTLKGYKHIIWDWNGTLLDDVDISIAAMNTLLNRRNMPLLDIEKYKKIIGFPIKNYYAQLGFNFKLEPFEKLASEFINEFRSDKYQLRLFNGVKEILSTIKKQGISQYILSATREQELVEAVNRLNISNYFTAIAGLNNQLAASKIQRGVDLLADVGVKADEVIMIGDTIHDYEVAKVIGCACLLVSSGHQSFDRLSNCNTIIIEKTSDVIGYFKEEAIA